MKRIVAVDLFCGAGGASTGLLRAAKAMGVEVDLLAINHWPQAVETHLLNHPHVRHKCEAIERIQPRVEVPGGRVNILLAGPECTHHSTARGGRPINDQSRATAWCVVKWAQELYIDSIIIENVPEFRSWGPLGVNGRPLKSRKGEVFNAYLDAFRALDYRVDVREVNCADYGDPTTRRRLFILLQRGRNRVLFPAPTHSRSGGATLFGQTKKWRGAKEIIDWSVPGQSIFNRKKPLAPATMARIMAGLEKFGGPDLAPFLVLLRGGQTAASIERPLTTVATSGAHHGLAQPFIVPVNHGSDSGHKPRSADEPLPTLTAKANQYLVQPFVLGQQSNAAPRSTEDPAPTIATAGKVSLVQSFVLGQHTGSVPRQTDQPLPTVAADGAISLVQPFIVDAAHGSGGGQIGRRAKSIEAPLGTVTGSNRFAVAEPFIVSAGGAPLRQPRSTDEPLPTVMGSDRLAVATPVLIQTSERRDTRSRSVDPVHTITAVGGRCIGLAEPFVTKYNGTAKTAQSTDEPLDTVTSKDRFAIAQPFVLQTSHGQRTHDLDKPLPTVTTARGGDFGIVQPVVDGMVLDIHFRMLQPHELAAAMSFPPEYEFTGTRESVVKQIGNAWPGETAKALCAELLRPYAEKAKGGSWRKERTA